MTQTASLPAPQHMAGGYRHEALLWHGTDDFVAQTVPFLQDAVAQGIPVMVAVPGAHWEPVRAELGAAADEVDYVDMTVLGHNPARIIPAWSDFIARNGGGTRPVRGIGEPIWAGRRPQELVECQIHEALLNLAVPAETPLWLLCPYDTENLDDDVLAEASRSHPTLVHDGGLVASGTYGGPEHPLALATRPLAPPPAHREELAFGDGELGAVRRVVRRHAAEAGLTGRRAGDLVVGVNEIAANSIDHGGGQGVLRAWRDADALVLEIQDRGRIVDPLAGRSTPTPSQARGRGLWMVNRLCDLTQVRPTTDGTTVRISTWL